MDSQIISALIGGIFTLFTALIAIWVFLKQKADAKSDAANILLLEIKNAEKVATDIKTLKRNDESLNGIDTNKFLLPTNSWYKYNYLFVKDFDANEWDRISSFYSLCESCDKFLKESATLFPLNIQGKIDHMQQTLAVLTFKFAMDSFALGEKYNFDISDLNYISDSSKLNNKFLRIKDIFTTSYTNTINPNFLAFYTPVGSYNSIGKTINDIDTNLSTNSVGIKLIKLAKKKKLIVF